MPSNPLLAHRGEDSRTDIGRFNLQEKNAMRKIAGAPAKNCFLAEETLLQAPV